MSGGVGQPLQEQDDSLGTRGPKRQRRDQRLAHRETVGNVPKKIRAPEARQPCFIRTNISGHFPCRAGWTFIVFWRRLGLQFPVMNTIWKAQLLVLALLASAALWPQTNSQAQTNNASQTYKPATLHRVRVSPGIAADNLIHKIVPEYPPKAKENHIQGAVVLHVIIDKQGQVIDLKTVSGHPDLVPAATDAVKQWRYNPYLLNGEPVEVETTVTVNFNQAPAPSSSSSPTAPSSTTAPAPGASPTSAANPGSSSDSSPPPPGYPKVTMNRVRVSGGVAESYLIHKIVPEYPEQARQSGIQGTVVLHAIIDKAGYIIELNPLSGNPILVPAALDAVKQWRYSPYILNGGPVEMETIVTVSFQ